MSELESDRADAYAFALSLAVLTWIADAFDADREAALACSESDRETARVCLALETIVRFSAALDAGVPPINADVVENATPVDFAERAKARAELDAWMREGVKALHAPQPKVQR